MNNKTCILLFSRTAESEAKHKTLHSVKSRNQLVHKKLYDRCLDIIHKTEIPLIHFNEAQQVGTTFGSKLTNAISKSFEKFENVIVIGSDCPTLGEKDLLHAAESLANNYQVIGHDGRGGSYLIGIKRAHWNSTAFLEIDWNTNQVSKQLEVLLSSVSTLVLLDKRIDINQFYDLLKIKAIAFKTRIFIQILIETIQNKQISLLVSSANFLLHIGQSLNFRGPPSLKIC